MVVVVVVPSAVLHFGQCGVPCVYVRTYVRMVETSDRVQLCSMWLSCVGRFPYIRLYTLP